MIDTTTEFEHLDETTKALARLDDKARIKLIRAGFWIPLRHAKKALNKMEDLLDHPIVTRMPNMLLIGPSFSGKTSILERFVELHLPDLDPEKEVTTCPVVMIDAPPKPDISDFYSRILDNLMAPYKPTSPSHEKYSQVKRLFKQMSVRLLIIDEVHHLIAGSLNRQREFRNALKSLGNETKTCIVAAGIEDAYNAFNADSQMSSRFVPFVLPSWGADQHLGELLLTLEMRTPLRRPSHLTRPEMLIEILNRSEGTLGDICDLFKAAAVDAILNKAEHISVEQLRKLDWVPPSKRKQHRRA